MTGTTILEAAGRCLDFGIPVASMLVLVPHLIPDSDDPWRIVGQLVDAVPNLVPAGQLHVDHGW